jgi:hypothetical protein
MIAAIIFHLATATAYRFAQPAPTGIVKNYGFNPNPNGSALGEGPSAFPAVCQQLHGHDLRRPRPPRDDWRWETVNAQVHLVNVYGDYLNTLTDTYVQVMDVWVHDTGDTGESIRVPFPDDWKPLSVEEAHQRLASGALWRIPRAAGRRTNPPGPR